MDILERIFYLYRLFDNIVGQDTCPLGPGQVQAMKCDQVFVSIFGSFKIWRQTGQFVVTDA